MAIPARIVSFMRRTVAGELKPATERLLLVGLCLVVFVPQMFRGLMNPDETRYALIVREMAESGDWVVPRLNGAPFVEKPPLTYWLAAVSVRLLGFSPWALRLAPMLAAILGILITYEFGSAIRSRRTGLIAGALLATSGLYLVLAVSLVTDMIFSVLLTGAFWTIWRYYCDEGRQLRWIVFFWLFAAFACLAKGPLALVLLGVAGLTFLGLRGELAFVTRMRPLLGWAIIAIVNAIWIVPLILRDPRLASFFYVRLHLSAVGGGDVLHSGPIYDYLEKLPLALFPWSFPAILALGLAVREIHIVGRKTAPAGLVWLAAISFGILFVLHVSKAKLITYALPLFPVMMILLARWIENADRGARHVRRLIPVQCFLAGASALTLLAIYEVEHYSELKDKPAFVAAVLAGVVIAVVLVLASLESLQGRLGRSLLVLGVASSVCFPAAVIVAPELAGWRASERLCRQYGDLLLTADLVVTEDSDEYAVPLALGRRTAVMGRAGEMGFGLFVETNPTDATIPNDPGRLRGRHLDTPWLLDESDLVAVWSSDRVVCLFTEVEHLGDYQSLDLALLEIARKGEMVLLSNRITDAAGGQKRPKTSSVSSGLPPRSLSNRVRDQESRTLRTLRASVSGRNGFWRKAAFRPSAMSPFTSSSA